MDITKSREDFEKWVESDIDRMITMQCPIYRSVALSAWQAARESIEVELPDFDPYGYPSKLNYDIKQALANAGIRIKGGGK
ncbi:hypothetical protein vBYenSP400_08 [Yersinia phage vB_YenS_P400]|nr:hypothetical protein vBYenSP400_08 [Yersinia phage vB_YenS_P400]